MGENYTMPSAAEVTIIHDGNRKSDGQETCQYCRSNTSCYTNDSLQSAKYGNNGPLSLRIPINPHHHTCTTPVTELPGHRCTDRIRFLYPGCCRHDSQVKPQMTTRGRSTQRRGRLMQLSGVPINNDGFHTTQQNAYPPTFNPKFNNMPNSLPPPHPFPNGNTNHHHISDGSRNNHPYAGPFLPKKFTNGSNSSGTPLSMDSDPPSVLLSTATPEDDTSNNERPSRWSRHRGRTTRKRSPSARQRASASVIRQQDCSPPPVQRDRPPSPPRTESNEVTMVQSPSLMSDMNRNSELDKKECPICQPRYSQSPEKLGVRPILSKKLSVDSSSLFVHEMIRDPYVNGKNHQHQMMCSNAQGKKESRQERRRRARSEYRPTNNNSRRRQTSPDINMYNRNNEKYFASFDSNMTTNNEDLHNVTCNNVRYPKNIRNYHDQHTCMSSQNEQKVYVNNKTKHVNNQCLSYVHGKKHPTDLNGNEDKNIVIGETRTNEYEEPKLKSCKETLRKKFSSRSISKASKSRRHGRKGQQNYQESSNDLKSPGLLIHGKENIALKSNTENSMLNNGRKISNISRSKSRSRFGELFHTGLQTIWPAKAGVWLPQ